MISPFHLSFIRLEAWPTWRASPDSRCRNSFLFWKSCNRDWCRGLLCLFIEWLSIVLAWGLLLGLLASCEGAMREFEKGRDKMDNLRFNFNWNVSATRSLFLMMKHSPLVKESTIESMGSPVKFYSPPRKKTLSSAWDQTKLMSRDCSLPHYEERKTTKTRKKETAKISSKLTNSPFGEHLRKTPLISRRAISTSVSEAARSHALKPPSSVPQP